MMPLTVDAMDKFMEEQSSLNNGVRQVLKSYGFDPSSEEGFAFVESMVVTSGVLASKKLMKNWGKLQETAEEHGEQMNMGAALTLGSTCEALLVGLAIGYGLGIREDPK